jgi:hypothetical protein
LRPVYTGSVTICENRRLSFTSLLELLAVSEDIGEFVRPAICQNGVKSASPRAGVPPQPKTTQPPPPLRPISLEDEDADAENEEEESEMERPVRLFETNLGGGVTLQRISAKSNKNEGGKVGGLIFFRKN